MSWAIWITGLPGSGKTTLARTVAQALRERGLPIRVLELATVRKALLGGRMETDHERELVHRVLAYTAMMLVEAGVPVIVDATAPRRAWREWARALIPHFGEVQLVCSPEICMTREQAERWRRPPPERPVTTGQPEVAIDYEPSLRPDLTLDTEAQQLWTAVDEVLRLAQRLERAADHAHH